VIRPSAEGARDAVDAAGESAAPGLLIDPAGWTPPFDWGLLFGNAGPVEVEIGCGKGMFLKEAARAHPQVNYLGVERARKYLAVAQTRLERAGASNVRLLRADGLDVLSRWAGARTLRVIHIYFPDPWPKTRHHKRRIFGPALLSLAQRSLCPDGEIRLATDNAPYAEAIRDLFRAAADRFGAVEWPDDDPERFPTNYERKWLRAGRSLWWARYRLLAR
jgi:tRNA (guanine-N7-)-methyltransferase